MMYMWELWSNNHAIQFESISGEPSTPEGLHR